ncbi:MAG: DUF3307 domain-containing protein [Candidatus Desulforudaceae bacterium]|nr:DUF3307 domain-containing protein [Eubacteriales bacterium]MDZ7609266.1 DUF3307 domain-containing protein [Eubacteriales bacterium]
MVVETLSMVGLLLVIHVAFDAYLRPDKWLGLHRTFPGLVIHSITWGGALSFALFWLAKFGFFDFFFLAVTHFLIDAQKRSLQQRFGRNTHLVDQFLHTVTVIVVLVW